MHPSSPAAQLATTLEQRFGPARRFGHSLFWSVRSSQTNQWVLDLWLDAAPDADPSVVVLRTDRTKPLRPAPSADKVMHQVHAAIAQ